MSKPAGHEKQLPFISIQWRIFTMLSIMLIAVACLFLMGSQDHFQEQFETKRQEAQARNARHLESLLDQSITRMNIAVAQFSAMDDVVHLLSANRLDDLQQLEQFWWSLQLEAGAGKLQFFDLQGKHRFGFGNMHIHPELVRDVLQKEQPTTLINCGRFCEIELIAPVQEGGKLIGAVAMSSLIADVMLEFNKITGSHIAVLFDVKNHWSHQNTTLQIPEWHGAVSAITSPEEHLPLLKAFAAEHRIESLYSTIPRITFQEREWEFQLIELKSTRFIVLTDVSNHIGELMNATRIGTAFIAISFLVMMLMMWFVLSEATRGLRKLSNILPLFSQKKYDLVDEELSKGIKHRWAMDEYDVLNEGAIQLNRQLMFMQQELEDRAIEIQHERDIFRTILHNAEAAIVLHDFEAKVVSINEFGAKLLGRRPEQLVGRRSFWRELKRQSEEHADDLTQLMMKGEGSIQYEAFLNRNGQEKRYLTWRHVCLSGDTVNENCMISIGTDITDRKRTETQMEWLATHDSLTKLNNRLSFNRLLEEIEINGREKAGVLFIDLDDFKEVNDYSGHHVGDELLVKVATTLQQNARESDIVARLGGDEFAVICPGSDEQALGLLAERFSKALAEIEVIGETYTHTCGSSIGGAAFGDQAMTAEQLLINADMAMYEAKQAGKNCFCIFYEKSDLRVTNCNVSKAGKTENASSVLKLADHRSNR